ncbi:hypothetical protein B0H16DRAFT_1505216 [Mycena metata]|uniref:BRCT domain-containing protein n=1 Tax=Mycena metata TaxID=1033252 RepID=A0AAD7NVY9_9AGAR|nr:hypothetical protein B0H16DRAFT_1505216 [Mycena metata]
MLFSGTAWFSRAVHAKTRDLWVKYGGSLIKQDFHEADLFFCDGPNDPSLKKLLSRSLIVRHARWISKSASEQFAVPVSKYLLDDQFDPTKIEPPLQRRDPSKAATPPRKPLAPTQPPHEELGVIPAKPNALKRSLDSENRDESSIELDSRPLKRARTQLPQSLAAIRSLASPTLVGIIQPSAPIPIFPTRAGPTKLFYPSPANSSPPLPDSRAKLTPRADKPLHCIDFTTLKPDTSVLALPHIDFTALKPIPSVLSFPRPRRAARCTANTRSHMNVANTPHLVEATAYKPPRLSIAALLRAPRADACVFEVSTTYRDKVFSCVNIMTP